MTSMPKPALILASSSPRRRELLDAIGLAFEIRSADVDETVLDEEPARDMVLRLARAKATALPIGPETTVIGADTAVVLEGEIFGKPRDEEDAVDMLTRLSGRAHEVLTGVAVANAESVFSAVSATVVRFRDIGTDEARQGERVGRGAFGYSYHPAAPPAVAEEGLHGRRQVRVLRRAGRGIPGQRQVFAEDIPEAHHVFYRHRHVYRTARRKADEGRHVHAWQGLRRWRRHRLKVDAR